MKVKFIGQRSRSQCQKVIQGLYMCLTCDLVSKHISTYCISFAFGISIHADVRAKGKILHLIASGLSAIQLRVLSWSLPVGHCKLPVCKFYDCELLAGVLTSPSSCFIIVWLLFWPSTISGAKMLTNVQILNIYAVFIIIKNVWYGTLCISMYK